MVKILVITTMCAIMCFGCSQHQPESVIHTVKARAVDANKNSIIDDGDLFILYDRLDEIYNDKMLPYMERASIGNKIELGSPTGMIKLRGGLTVVEFERIIQNIAEYNLVSSQIEVTAEDIANKGIDPPKLVSKSDKALGVAVWGQIELASGIVIKYAGIKIPVGATDNRYSRVVSILSNKYIAGRLIRYELTGVKIGNTNEAYIYVGDLCINEELVKRGYAIANRDKSDRSDKFIKLEETAKAGRRGLWDFYPQDDPFAEKSLY